MGSPHVGRPDGESVPEGLPSDQAENAVHEDAKGTGLPWKKIGVAVGGAAVVAGTAVVATLAATHNTAVSENAKAYANGMMDALEAVRNGFDAFDV